VIERPDRWFYIGDYDLAAEFTPLYRYLDRFMLEIHPPRGWVRVSYTFEGAIPIPTIHANCSNAFALDALERLLGEELEARLTDYANSVY